MKHAFSASTLPQKVPLFPLPGALLLPRARLPLNIFEPRYLAMLDDALKTDHRLIGMIQPCEGPHDIGKKQLHQIGCAGRVTSFTETDDGRYLVNLSGVSRFRLVSEESGFTPYIFAEISWDSFLHDLTPSQPDARFDRPAFLALLERYFERKGLTSDWDSLKEADEDLLINSLAALCPFGTEEKQALLEAPQLSDRREILTTLMQFSLRPSGSEGGKMQ